MPHEQVATHEETLDAVVYLHLDACGRLPFDDAVAGASQQLDGTTLRTASDATTARHAATHLPACIGKSEEDARRGYEEKFRIRFRQKCTPGPIGARYGLVQKQS